VLETKPQVQFGLREPSPALSNMPAWRANREGWAARAEEQARREAEQAAPLLVTNIVVRVLVCAASRARHPVYINENLDWHSRARQTLETIARRALITSQDCVTRVSMLSAQGTALCPVAVLNGAVAQEDFPFKMFLKPSSLLRTRFDLNADKVPVECVTLGTKESWPKSQKIKQKQVIARGLAGSVQARLQSVAIQSAFRGWQLAWHFSQRTLRELARDIDADLSSQTDQSDLRRTATWPCSACSDAGGLHRTMSLPSSARCQRAATNPRRKPTLREFARDIDIDFSLQTHQSDLYPVATWPPTARSQPAAAKPRRKCHKRILEHNELGFYSLHPHWEA